MERRSVRYKDLQAFTHDFSEEGKHVLGAYGEVYKGKFENGEVITVKMFTKDGRPLDGVKFCDDEFKFSLGLNHQNIIRPVGFCYERHGFPRNELHQALCLEYCEHGSLQKHLSEKCDELDWPTCHKIINGTCRGLNYLREKLEHNIIHLDIKDDNILLNMNMEPKLAYLGLTGLFGQDQTQIKQRTIETSSSKNSVPPMFIFGLGGVMIKMLAGPEGLSKADKMSPDEFIELVHQKWRERWGGSMLEAYYEQLETCTKIALKCISTDSDQRPDIMDIIGQLNKGQTVDKANEEGQYMAPSTDETGKSSTSLHLNKGPEVTTNEIKKLIQVDATQLRFSSEPNNEVSCSLKLVNSTEDHVAVTWGVERAVQSTAWYDGDWIEGILLPQSTSELILTRISRQGTRGDLQCEDKIILRGTTVNKELRICDITEDMFEKQPEGPIVGDLELDIVLEQTWEAQDMEVTPHTAASPKLPSYEEEIEEYIHNLQPLVSTRQPTVVNRRIFEPNNFHVHPVEPWVLATQGHGDLLIWNHLTQESNIVNITKYLVNSAIFVASEYWVVAGISTGAIHVYTDDLKEKIREVKNTHGCVQSLAVHPFEPYILAGCGSYGKIMMWDYKNNWEMIHEFEVDGGGPARNVAFYNSMGTQCIARSNTQIKIVDLHYSFQSTVIPCKHIFDDVMWMDYFKRGLGLYLIVAFGKTAEIWDCQTGAFLEILEGHTQEISAVCSHPDLPILLTGSDDGTVCLWNSHSFKHEGMLNFDFGRVSALACLKDSRVVIGYDNGIVLTAIDLKVPVRTSFYH